jgi:polyisoprenoid-binding protein YceI
MRYLTALTSILALGGATIARAADTYHLEKTHVDLLFSISHAGFTEKHGSFRDLDATLQYDAARPENSQVTVVVKTDSLDTAFAPRDKDVKSDKFLDVAKYPEMRFVSTKVTREPDERLRIDGQLTLHGVTKPLTLHARLNKEAPNPFDKRPTLGFSATGSLKRSDFGIATYIPVIGDEVSLTIDAEFNRSVTETQRSKSREAPTGRRGAAEAIPRSADGATRGNRPK